MTPKNRTKQWVGRALAEGIVAADINEFMARLTEMGVDTRPLRVMWPEGRVVARAYQDGGRVLVEGFHKEFNLRRWWGPMATWITVGEEWEWLDGFGWAHFIWQGYTHPHPKHPQFSGKEGTYEAFELWRLEDSRYLLRIEHVNRGNLEGTEAYTFATPEDVVAYLNVTYPQVAQDCARTLGLVEEE